MTRAAQSLGAAGEEMACDYLRRHGYIILDRNLRLGQVEVDILARDGSTVVIVEVKTRSSDAFGRPEESVTPTKQRRLAQAAVAYSAAHPEARVRLDVISLLVTEPGAGRLRHYKGIGEDLDAF